jgi:lipoprotein-anchoring transpeptidase ErfK/SrfK
MKTFPYSTGVILGGNIEIHGKGGKLCNWTDGCAALSDADIDTLYSIVSVGTPVTIIGTTSSSLADSLR